ncbi:hypothetical protein V5N11_016182 [Cardamine amara subsp. amara]|uniref:Transmembrane protein n=1 Tax=Cardamine amara subsp. amara TaxID=228776 RepID=A0ABD1BMP4_CARAN
MESPLLRDDVESPLLRNDEDFVEITIDDYASVVYAAVSRPTAIVLTSIELLMTLVQIVAAILVVKGTKGEHPEATWILVYTCGCIASLPILCWCFWQITSPFSHLRINRVVFRLKKTLEFFFLVWFLGFFFVFVFSSSSLDHTSQLFWLCVVFLAFGCIRHVLPFVICTTMCCCLTMKMLLEYIVYFYPPLYPSYFLQP